jgi:hypothetical protein
LTLNDAGRYRWVDAGMEWRDVSAITGLGTGGRHQAIQLSVCVICAES